MLLNRNNIMPTLLLVIIKLLSSCCKGIGCHQYLLHAYNYLLAIIGTSIRLSPLGMVSVCPGGQVLLTCERITGSFLYWDVSIPRLDAMSREIIVSNQGDIDTTALQQFNGLQFTVTRTSENPLISQLLIKNVTTEINGSTIYCSEDGNENGASAVAVNVIYYYYGIIIIMILKS